jgi:HTH-type transcriptional regulator/antitoxin HigA
MMDDPEFKTPGQLIDALLSERGWTQRVLGVVLGVDETKLNKLVAAKRPVDAEMALMLGEVFDVDPDRFLALQRRYDLGQARLVAQPDPGRAKRAQLYGGLPISDMIKRGWIDASDVRDTKNVERGLTRFFGVETLDEIEFLPGAASFKRTNVVGGATPVQLAWLYRVRAIAEDMMTAQYSPFGVRGAVEKLKTLLRSAEEARKVPRILAEAGIRFVMVESLPGAKIDGVCFWLDDETPVIGMTFRYDRIDNFWFVLRHEIEHVLRLHGRAAMMLDAELEGERAGTGESVSEEERVANEAAAAFCVPQREMNHFVSVKAPFFATRDMLGFANTVGVHPGLVAGQLAHRTNNFKRFADYRVKIRSIVAPGAIVDGWGDVAPVDQ